MSSQVPIVLSSVAPLLLSSPASAMRRRPLRPRPRSSHPIPLADKLLSFFAAGEPSPPCSFATANPPTSAYTATVRSRARYTILKDYVVVTAPARSREPVSVSCLAVRAPTSDG